jgi:Tol biopolymer transport system component
VWSINPYGGWIYYLKDKDGDKQLMKVRYDGTEKQRIASGVNISSIYAQPRKLLRVSSHPAGFSFEYFLFTINQDGTGREEEANSERVSSFINFDEKWIYYRSGADGSLYRIRMDGTGKLKLVNEQPAAIHTGGGWVFYNHEGKTYMVKPDGTGLSELR